VRLCDLKVLDAIAVEVLVVLQPGAGQDLEQEKPAGLPRSQGRLETGFVRIAPDRGGVELFGAVLDTELHVSPAGREGTGCRNPVCFCVIAAVVVAAAQSSAVFQCRRRG
jgi:hypothetical protein